MQFQQWCVICHTSEITPPDNSCQCPTWIYWDETSKDCHCRHIFPVICDQEQNHTKVYWLYCMTYDSDTMTAVLGFSPFCNHRVGYSDYYLLPENRSQLNDAMWGRNNRERILCSRCMQGYGPSVLSYPHTCVKCSAWEMVLLVLVHFGSFDPVYSFSFCQCYVISTDKVRTIQNPKAVVWHWTYPSHCMEFGLFPSHHPTLLCEWALVPTSRCWPWTILLHSILSSWL